MLLYLLVSDTYFKNSKCIMLLSCVSRCFSYGYVSNNGTQKDGKFCSVILYVKLSVMMQVIYLLSSMQ